ncbi:MAG: EAL domain-containing protein, partial [Candidatus Limnocylindrales bacterium]
LTVAPDYKAKCRPHSIFCCDHGGGDVARLTHQRQGILEALVRLPANSTLQALAAAACEAMVVPGGFSQVAIIAVEPPSRIAIVGVAMDQETRDAGLPPVVEGLQAEAIIAKATDGPWVDDWSDPEGQPNHTLVKGVPIAAVAWAPIEADGRVIALLVVGGPLVAVEQEQRLASLVDLASIVAASTLGRALREHSTRIGSRARIQAVLDAGAFHAVFQPLVDLTSGRIFGYEALTRFEDGTPPDVVFAEAAAAGMSIQLEVATARAALEAASTLPANRTINLNVSPELILAREPIRTMLRESGFGVVLEITEHSAVTDYAMLRAAIAGIGPEVRLAIDDAGAGFSSLRHILELRPSMVKLDVSLIRGIDTDLARQAMVAGMVHFANRLAVSLIAEGVENEAEKATLLALGVTGAQGYLFGRPISVEAMRER